MIEQVKEFIAEEIGYWNRLRSDADPELKTKIDGALAELIQHAGSPELVTSEYLRERYRYKKARSKSDEINGYTLDLIAKNRAVKAYEAIVRLGKKVSVIDKKAKDS